MSRLRERRDETRSPETPHPVAIVAYPGVNILDITGPLQVFTTANETLATEGRSPFYEARICADAGGSVMTSSGLAIDVDRFPRVDGHTIVVGGSPSPRLADDNPDTVAWLAGCAVPAKRVASVCTGAFLLAAAGLLDGRRAVTHWSRCGALAEMHPRVRVERDPIFIQEGKVWTSAGITAGIDLALAMVAQDVSHSVALTVARHLVVFLKRSGGQAQFSSLLSLQKGHASFDELHSWISDHLSEPLPVAKLARQMGMSERTFARRYHSRVGITPGRAVEQIRVEAARQLLESTALPLKRIAAQCGFGSDENMRRTFVKVLSVSPQLYRQNFGAAPEGSMGADDAAARVRPTLSTVRSSLWPVVPLGGRWVNSA